MLLFDEDNILGVGQETLDPTLVTLLDNHSNIFVLCFFSSLHLHMKKHVSHKRTVFYSHCSKHFKQLASLTHIDTVVKFSFFQLRQPSNIKPVLLRL